MANTSAAQQACKVESADTEARNKLLSCCKSAKQRLLFNLVMDNQGVLTHDLNELLDFKSNNHHNFTQKINPRLIKMGWVISKHRPQTPTESWRWFIEPAHQALQQNITDALRATILKYMRAANDE